MIIQRSIPFIGTQNICLSSAIKALYQCFAHRPRLKFGIVWIRIELFTRIRIIYLSVVFYFYMYVWYVEYPFEIRCSNCSASLSSSLLETRKMTANIFGHFSFSISFRLLAFGFIVLLRCCRPNETKQKEKKRGETNRETRNETKRNEIQIEIEIQIWIWILLKLLLLIAKYTHRAEQRESCNGDRGIRGGCEVRQYVAVAVCFCLARSHCLAGWQCYFV